MLNLEANKTGNTDRPEDRVPLILYQTEECLDLIQQSLRFAGLPAARHLQCAGSQILEQVNQADTHLVIIEQDQDIAALATSLSKVAARDMQLIFVGRKNDISLCRQLQRMGFHYLLWPAEKLEIVSLLNICSRTNHAHGESKRPGSAIRIAVTSAKGGSGCTMIATELARNLVAETKRKGILADQSLCSGNMHIMLGRSDLKRQPLGNQLLNADPTGTIDHITANSFLTRIDKHLSYLGLIAESGFSGNLTGICSRVLTALSADNHFIVEDIPGTVTANNFRMLLSHDCLIQVIDLSLSGLHQAREWLHMYQLAMAEQAFAPRLILVLNHCHPASKISRQDAEAVS